MSTLNYPPIIAKLDDYAWKQWFQDVYNLLMTTTSAASFAPKGATYVTLSNEATLSSERVLTAGANITITDNGANNTVVIASTGGQFNWGRYIAGRSCFPNG